MSHKKSNDELQTLNQYDRLKWEAAKEVAIEGEPVQVGRLMAEEDDPTGKNPVKAAIDRAEERISRDSARKTEENLRDHDVRHDRK